MLGEAREIKDLFIDKYQAGFNIKLCTDIVIISYGTNTAEHLYD